MFQKHNVSIKTKRACVLDCNMCKWNVTAMILIYHLWYIPELTLIYNIKQNMRLNNFASSYYVLFEMMQLIQNIWKYIFTIYLNYIFCFCIAFLFEKSLFHKIPIIFILKSYEGVTRFLRKTAIYLFSNPFRHVALRETNSRDQKIS